MAIVSVGLGVLSPVLIDPIFNKFTRIEDDELHADLVDLAHEVGSDIAEVQVSDASRRTRKHNAYVTGLGKTRKLVLFDTLLEQRRGHTSALSPRTRSATGSWATFVAASRWGSRSCSSTSWSYDWCWSGTPRCDSPVSVR